MNSIQIIKENKNHAKGGGRFVFNKVSLLTITYFVKWKFYFFQLMVNMVNGMTLAPVHNHVDSLEQKKQKRLCDNPQPRNGGKDCLDQHSLGPNIKTIPCNTHIICSSKYKWNDDIS